MKTARKALMLILCAALLVSATVMGTLAYLTSKDTVTNTFSVGKVAITLDELDVDNSTEGENDRDKANAYHLLPGETYDKDPTVHVLANSEDAWVFVNVENDIAPIEAASDVTEGGYKTIADQITAKGWTPLSGVDNVYYREHAKNTTEIKDYVVFENFKIDGTKVVNGTANTNKGEVSIDGYVTNATNGVTITVTAYAIQKAGFEPVITEGATEATPEAKLAAATLAWNALNTQLGNS